MAYASDNFANAAKFNLDLSAFVAKQKTNIVAKVKKVVISIHNDCIRLTRVDTGRARGNWNIAFGRPDPSIWEPPEHHKSSTNRGGTANAAAATEKSLEHQSILAAYELPNVIVISNSVPYIGYLEFGTGRPGALENGDHMMQQALQNARAMIESNSEPTPVTETDAPSAPVKAPSKSGGEPSAPRGSKIAEGLEEL